MLQIPFLTEIDLASHLYFLKRFNGVLKMCIFTRNDEMAWNIYLKHSQSALASRGLRPPDPLPGICLWAPTGGRPYLKHSQSASACGDFWTSVP